MQEAGVRHLGYGCCFACNTSPNCGVWSPFYSFTVPLKVHNGLPAPYAQAKAIFSPDESLVITGKSLRGAREAHGCSVTS